MWTEIGNEKFDLSLSLFWEYLLLTPQLPTTAVLL